MVVVRLIIIQVGYMDFRLPTAHKSLSHEVVNIEVPDIALKTERYPETSIRRQPTFDFSIMS